MWFGPTDAAALRLADDAADGPSRGGVLLAPPVGREARAARRAFRRMRARARGARASCRCASTTTARVTRRATFDDPDRDLAWTESVARGRRRSCAPATLDSVSAVGMRLGATIVGAAAGRRTTCALARSCCGTHASPGATTCASWARSRRCVASTSTSARRRRSRPPSSSSRQRRPTRTSAALLSTLERTSARRRGCSSWCGRTGRSPSSSAAGSSRSASSGRRRPSRRRCSTSTRSLAVLPAANDRDDRLVARGRGARPSVVSRPPRWAERGRHRADRRRAPRCASGACTSARTSSSAS